MSACTTISKPPCTALAPPRVFAFSTRGTRHYADVQYAVGDALLFGPETRGLPADVLDSISADHRLRIPMRPESRSLNLSNAVAVVVYEAWRQFGFSGARRLSPSSSQC